MEPGAGTPAAAHGEVVAADFQPPWWLRGAHAQTLWGSMVRRPPDTVLREEVLETPDGDVLELVWGAAPPPARGAPVVLLVHGLAGSAESVYLQGILAALTRRGVLGVALSMRGCGKAPNRQARGYHSGYTDDVEHVLAMLAERFPGRSLRAAGISMGGNILLCHAGRRGAESPLDRVVAVCPPLDLVLCSRRLSTGLSRLYQGYLLRRLQDGIRRKADIMAAAGLDVGAILGARSFREFDDRCTAPLFGFRDAQHYYVESSSRPLLRHIRVPTTILFAHDDPFMDAAMIPAPQELAPQVRLELARHGGHVGFIEGPGRCWLDRRVPDALLGTPKDSTGSAR